MTQLASLVLRMTNHRNLNRDRSSYGGNRKRSSQQTQLMSVILKTNSAGAGSIGRRPSPFFGVPVRLAWPFFPIPECPPYVCEIPGYVLSRWWLHCSATRSVNPRPTHCTSYFHSRMALFRLPMTQFKDTPKGNVTTSITRSWANSGTAEF